MKHARWFKQMKGIVSFDVTTRFNPNQKSIAIYNSHIFNDHNTTIKDQLTHSKYTEVFFYYPCVRQYFYINHIYNKSSHYNVSKLSDYYKIARSFTVFSPRKCTQLHHLISLIYSDLVYIIVKSNVTKSNFFALQMSISN